MCISPVRVSVTVQIIDELELDKTEAGVPAVRERSKRRRRRTSKSRSRRRKSGRRSKRGRVRRAYYGNGKKYSLI